MQYVAFQETKNFTAYKDLKDALKSSPLLAPLAPTLEKRILPHPPSDTGSHNNDNNRDFRFRAYYNTDLNLHLIMVNGRSDQHLNEMAKEFNFPRGLPLLWKAGEFISARGFYPKFDNNTKDQQTIKPEALHDAVEVVITKKWSGFLVQVICFKIGEQYYWTTTSKQAANPDSPYVLAGRALFEPHMTPELCMHLADNNLYIGFEAMSTDDEHGYIAKQNAAVITCIGEGSTDASLPTDPIMKFLSLNEISEFCRKFSLPHNGYTRITGTNAQIVAATKALFDERDFLNYTKFEAANLNLLLHPEEYGDVRIYSGSLDHRQIVGECLEGAVAHYIKSDGGKFTIKIKFPCYTIRTFFMRRLLELFVDRRSYTKAFFPAISASMDQYFKTWCCTEEGKTLWRNKAKVMALCGVDRPLVTKRTHVEIADLVDAMSEDEMLEKLATFDVFHTYGCLTRKPVSIIVILGPIGSGKSTLAEHIVSARPEAYVHVDGDRFHGSSILDFGPERNAASLSQILEIIVDGKVPVVSCGGGILVRDGRCILADRIKSYFGCTCNLVVGIMCPRVSKLDFMHPITSPDTINEAYTELPPSFTESVIKERIQRGTWRPMYPTEIKAVHNGSVENRTFAKVIYESAPRSTFRIPFDPLSPQTSIAKFRQAMSGDQHSIHMFLDRAITNYMGLVLKTRQIRFMIRINNTAKHITERFSIEDIQLTKTDFDELRAKAETLDTTATVWDLKLTGESDPKNQAKISFATLKTGQHITLSPGPFEARHMATAAEWIMGSQPAPLSLKTKDKTTFSIHKLEEDHKVVMQKPGGNEGTFERMVQGNCKFSTVPIQVLGVAVVGQFDNPAFFTKKANK